MTATIHILRSAPWRQGETNTLHALWCGTNMSCGQIGLRLSRSRNSIIGKAHRMQFKRGTLRLPPEKAVQGPPPLPPSAPVQVRPEHATGCRGCGKTPQPGRVHCAECLRDRMPARSRADVWGGLIPNVGS